MPTISKTFEFYNPWSTRNTHTTQVGITMPQMVDGRKPDPVLTLYSNRIEGSGYYKLGPRTHVVAYTVEGSFRGTLSTQYNLTPNPLEENWITIPESVQTYTGLETTGGAGISGGFSGAVSRPTVSISKTFSGDYAWLRVKLDIEQGTLQSVRLNF